MVAVPPARHVARVCNTAIVASLLAHREGCLELVDHLLLALLDLLKTAARLKGIKRGALAKRDTYLVLEDVRKGLNFEPSEAFRA